MTEPDTARRHVLLLDTDERAGLVAAIAEACASRHISLEIATGPAHVLIATTADDSSIDSVTAAFLRIPGVAAVYPYTVK
ncbi:MAG: hypothetical protein ACLQVD_09450 [Capsulimonadaceae bacterium]